MFEKVFGLHRFTSASFILEKHNLYSLSQRVSLKLHVFAYCILNRSSSSSSFSCFTREVPQAEAFLPGTLGNSSCGVQIQGEGSPHGRWKEASSIYLPQEMITNDNHSERKHGAKLVKSWIDL